MTDVSVPQFSLAAMGRLYKQAHATGHNRRWVAIELAKLVGADSTSEVVIKKIENRVSVTVSGLQNPDFCKKRNWPVTTFPKLKSTRTRKGGGDKLAELNELRAILSGEVTPPEDEAAPPDDDAPQEGDVVDTDPPFEGDEDEWEDAEDEAPQEGDDAADATDDTE